MKSPTGSASYDALLVASFGGPEGPDDVRPFVANVLRGRPVPPERVEQVVHHYLSLGGRSPINDQNRALIGALGEEMRRRGDNRRIYWGNRNWEPYLADTVATMAGDGVRRAAVFVTSAYSGYSSCRQYLEDLQDASAALARAGLPSVEMIKVRPYFNHPGFVGPLADGLRNALRDLPPTTAVLMSAHSIPSAVASTSDYEVQLEEVGRLVADAAGLAPGRWRVVFQSRSGRPEQQWLEPDVNDAIKALPSDSDAVAVVPIGFVSDHMEVVYDLDTQAAETARRRGLRFVRTPSPGTDRRFLAMALELAGEVEGGRAHHLAQSVGRMAARPFRCPAACCPGPSRPAR